MTLEVLHRELYTLSRAGELLNVAPTTLEWWLEGKVTADHSYAPVLRPERTGSKMVTWGEFVEAGYVREYRRTHNVPLSHLRMFIEELRQAYGVPHPLAHYKPYVGERRKLIIELQQRADLPPAFWLFAPVGGEVVLLGPAASFLSKVEFSREGDQWAVRLHPQGKKSPVVFDPQFSYGEPTVRGIRTGVLAELVEAGEPMEEVAEQYGLTLAGLKAALSYEYSAAA